MTGFCYLRQKRANWWHTTSANLVQAMPACRLGGCRTVIDWGLWKERLTWNMTAWLNWKKEVYGAEDVWAALMIEEDQEFFSYFCSVFSGIIFHPQKRRGWSMTSWPRLRRASFILSGWMRELRFDHITSHRQRWNVRNQYGKRVTENILIREEKTKNKRKRLEKISDRRW